MSAPRISPPLFSVIERNGAYYVVRQIRSFQFCVFGIHESLNAALSNCKWLNGRRPR